MTLCRLAQVFTLSVLALMTGRARAFSDHELFAQPPLAGGGAGRYFTGSRQDPHACGVCHESGEKPAKLAIEGLPTRLVPGQKHDVTISWDAERASHALHLELATRDGVHADLELGALSARSRCEGSEQGEPAVFAQDLGERRVLGVYDCGASELRFSFTVPNVPELFFSLGAVRSDGSGSSDGDGVLELRQRIEREAVSSAGGCSALPWRAHDSTSRWWLALVVAGLWYARRRARPPLRFVWIFAALGCNACFQPQHEQDGSSALAADAAQPYLDAFSALLDQAGEGGAPVLCGPDPSPLKQLSVSVRTVSGAGRYRPRNVGAVWIETDDGVFVKTLEQWGKRRAKWLTAFNAASDGDVVDAVTGPTLQTHKVHELSWDLTGRDGCEVPNGRYGLRMEMTDKSGTGVQYTVQFAKDSEPLALAPPDQPTFRDMQVELQ